MKKLGTGLTLGVVLISLTGCTAAQPSTPEQRDCVVADEMLPTLRELQAGDLSDAETSEARADVHDAINNKVDPDGQVGVMLYVLSEPDDAATFADFERQLIEYCDDFAGWKLANG